MSWGGYPVELEVLLSLLLAAAAAPQLDIRESRRSRSIGVPSMISAAFLMGAWREAGGSQLISLLGTYSGTRNLRVVIYTQTMVIWGIQCGGDNMATVVCACYGSKVVLYRTLVSSRQRGERAGKGKWESW
jgi:hypothetical protein